MSRKAIPSLRDDKYYITEKSDGTRYYILLYSVRPIIYICINQPNMLYILSYDLKSYDITIDILYIATCIYILIIEDFNQVSKHIS